MRMNKKGALELSINAIVIIILAITLLGLGLGFVRGLFGDITGITGDINEQTREQINEQLRTGNKPLAFPTSEMEINKKQSKNVGVGIKNTLQGTRKFQVRIYEINETGQRQVTTKIPNRIDPPEINQGTFIYNKGAFELGTNEDHIMPIKYNAGAVPGTIIYEIVVFEMNQSTPSIVDSEYTTKSFFITTS